MDDIPLYFPTGSYGAGQEVIGRVMLDGRTASIELPEGSRFEDLLIDGGVYIGMAVLLSPSVPSPFTEPNVDKVENVCTTCRRELKIGQRVQTNHILVALLTGKGMQHKLGDFKYQHANCLDADGPRYDDSGNELYERSGYIKPETKEN